MTSPIKPPVPDPFRVVIDLPCGIGDDAISSYALRVEAESQGRDALRAGDDDRDLVRAGGEGTGEVPDLER